MFSFLYYLLLLFYQTPWFIPDFSLSNPNNWYFSDSLKVVKMASVLGFHFSQKIKNNEGSIKLEKQGPSCRKNNIFLRQNKGILLVWVYYTTRAIVKKLNHLKNTTNGMKEFCKYWWSLLATALLEQNILFNLLNEVASTLYIKKGNSAIQKRVLYHCNKDILTYTTYSLQNQYKMH